MKKTILLLVAGAFMFALMGVAFAENLDGKSQVAKTAAVKKVVTHRIITVTVEPAASGTMLKAQAEPHHMGVFARKSMKSMDAAKAPEALPSRTNLAEKKAAKSMHARASLKKPLVSARHLAKSDAT